jgi:hypothetical protein
MLAGEHRHCSAPGKEIAHHLPGYFGRVRRDPLRRKAVIRCKDQKLRRKQSWPSIAKDQSQLQRERFKPAERAPGLCLDVEVAAQRALELGLPDGIDLGGLEMLR